jgi:Flp pilus assembly protein TadG
MSRSDRSTRENRSGGSAERSAGLSLMKRWQKDERGNVMITAAILLPIVVGTVGAAVSYSVDGATRASMQNMLDAAVLAAAASTDLTPASSDSAISIANTYFQNNMGTVTRNTAKDVTATFTVSNATISGTATGTVTNPFGGLIGARAYTVGVKAAATKSSIPICVLGLNGLDNGAFDVNGGPVFNADCAVQANSNSKSGMSQEGKSATVKAKKFGVKGGHKTDSYVPPPTDGSAVIPDPYASLPFPPYAACDKNAKGLDIKDDTTLAPGTYCGGIHISGSGPKVTLQSGIYVMVDGPFWVDGGGIVTGDKVMIGFTGKGSTLQVWGDASVTLTSPTSGTYMNMQFMQDNSDTNTHGLWCSIGGNGGGGSSNGKLSFDGVAYFPTQNFWTFGNAVVNANSPSLAIVADKIWTQGNATVNVTHNNPRSVAVTPGPTTGFGARLLN